MYLHMFMSSPRWVHWGPLRNGTGIQEDFWPDMAEFTAAEKHVAPGYTNVDGSPAHLFSSDNRATVLRHFQWMEAYGIDGVPYSLIHSLARTHTHAQTFSFFELTCEFRLTHSLTHSNTHALTHKITALTGTFTHSLASLAIPLTSSRTHSRAALSHAGRGAAILDGTKACAPPTCTQLFPGCRSTNRYFLLISLSVWY